MVVPLLALLCTTVMYMCQMTLLPLRLPILNARTSHSTFTAATLKMLCYVCMGMLHFLYLIVIHKYKRVVVSVWIFLQTEIEQTDYSPSHWNRQYSPFLLNVKPLDIVILRRYHRICGVHLLVSAGLSSYECVHTRRSLTASVWANWSASLIQDRSDGCAQHDMGDQSWCLFLSRLLVENTVYGTHRFSILQNNIICELVRM